MGDKVTYEVIKQDLDIEMEFIKLCHENLYRIKNEKVREVFLHLLEDSLRHAITLTCILPDLQSFFEIQDELTHEDIMGLLRKSLKEEKDAVDLYNEHMRLIESKEVHHKIRNIFSDEIEHEKLVKDTIDMVLRDKLASIGKTE